MGEALGPEALRWVSELASRPSRDAGYTRRYFSYPAKFLAHLPRGLIGAFTRPGDLVYDGFCGGGTVGLEAMLLGRRSIGYDLNPFAILISRVKTTRLDPGKLRSHRRGLLATRGRRAEVLEATAVDLVGPRAARDVEALAGAIEDIPSGPYRDFFRLALIHSIKILGRRDHGGVAVVDHFSRRIARMAMANATLPAEPGHHPEFFLGSSHRTNIGPGEVDLIITSPPYKDVDVEYTGLQIQRPGLHRSFRSDAIARILGRRELPGPSLCGGRGNAYWAGLWPSVEEAHRILRPGGLAFWWIGFRSPRDLETFQGVLADGGFALDATIPVTLSPNRAASSRSIHHGRPTGMMKGDFLLVCRG